MKETNYSHIDDFNCMHLAAAMAIISKRKPKYIIIAARTNGELSWTNTVFKILAEENGDYVLQDKFGNKIYMSAESIQRAKYPSDSFGDTLFEGIAK